jgi:hypothetical protein
MLSKMKTALALAAFFSSTLATAQWQLDTVEYKNIVKFDALQAIVMEDYLISYERVVAPNASLVLTTGYLGGYWDQESTLSDGTVDRSYFVRNGVYIAPEFRYYLSDFTNERRPAGAYISAYPFAQLSWSNQRGELRPQSTGLFGVGGQWSPPYEANLDTKEHFYGLGTAIGMQLFVFHGLMFEAQFNTAIIYRDYEQVGFETDGFGIWQEADRRQFNRLFTSGARLFVGYAF